MKFFETALSMRQIAPNFLSSLVSSLLQIFFLVRYVYLDLDDVQSGVIYSSVNNEFRIVR